MVLYLVSWRCSREQIAESLSRAMLCGVRDNIYERDILFSHNPNEFDVSGAFQTGSDLHTTAQCGIFSLYDIDGVLCLHAQTSQVALAHRVAQRCMHFDCDRLTYFCTCHTLTVALSNLCRGKPRPELGAVKAALPALVQALLACNQMTLVRLSFKDFDVPAETGLGCPVPAHTHQFDHT